MSVIIVERVNKGVALLDAHFGFYWRARIDPDRLDMTDPYTCIIGQLWYDNYVEGVVDLGLPGNWVAQIDHGFDIDGTNSTYVEYAKALKAEWLERL